MSKFLRYCSCLVCKRELTVQGLAEHILFHTRIPKNHCKLCHALTKTKFCSNSCSARYNNSKRTCKPGPKPGSTMRPSFTKITQCSICGKFHPRKAKTCSKECTSKLLSIKVRRRMENGFNPNANRGRGKQSYLEHSFSMWLKETQPTLLCHTEYKFKRHDTGRWYFVDFYFPTLNTIIELDGSQHKYTTQYDMDRDNYLHTTYGVNVVRITHAEYQSKVRLPEIRGILSA